MGCDVSLPGFEPRLQPFMAVRPTERISFYLCNRASSPSQTVTEESGTGPRKRSVSRRAHSRCPALVYDDDDYS